MSMGSGRPALPEAVTIREVGPRDGLQAEAPVGVDERVRLIVALEAAGVREIEVAAFVSPKAVPSMAGATDLVATLRPARAGVRRWALVPNARGAELALGAGVTSLTVTVSASETYSRRNVHMSVAESMEQAATIASIARGVAAVDVVVSCAFGSPYEGDLSLAEVGRIVDRCRELEASVTLADTTGMATPRRVHELIGAVGAGVGLHLHDTRGTALVNAYAGLEAGVTRFDTSVGGLGGSPFAAGSAGNLATEDLVYLCDDLGLATGIDLGRLLDVSAMVAGLVGHTVPSRVASAGPRSRRADAVV
jgi:hydroxymethylglutaryl-CoA lyase